MGQQSGNDASRLASDERLVQDLTHLVSQLGTKEGRKKKKELNESKAREVFYGLSSFCRLFGNVNLTWTLVGWTIERTVCVESMEIDEQQIR